MTTVNIENTIKISEIKKTFNDKFPFLKIEFFKHKHKTLQGSPKKDIITNDFSISISTNDYLNLFNENVLVSDLEKQFADKFKLSAQIFRKSGKSWLETTFTDSWTLKKQNQEGIELSEI